MTAELGRGSSWFTDDGGALLVANRLDGSITPIEATDGQAFQVDFDQGPGPAIWDIRNLAADRPVERAPGTLDGRARIASAAHQSA